MKLKKTGELLEFNNEHNHGFYLRDINTTKETNKIKHKRNLEILS